jgi:hypothetical protein
MAAQSVTPFCFHIGNDLGRQVFMRSDWSHALVLFVIRLILVSIAQFRRMAPLWVMLEKARACA